MRDKLDQLGNKWDIIVRTANERASNIMEALNVAEGFWEELHSTNLTMKDIQDQINSQEAPAVEELAVRDQQDILHVGCPSVAEGVVVTVVTPQWYPGNLNPLCHFWRYIFLKTWRSMYSILYSILIFFSVYEGPNDQLCWMGYPL